MTVKELINNPTIANQNFTFDSELNLSSSKDFPQFPNQNFKELLLQFQNELGFKLESTRVYEASVSPRGCFLKLEDKTNRYLEPVIRANWSYHLHSLSIANSNNREDELVIEPSFGPLTVTILEYK